MGLGLFGLAVILAVISVVVLVTVVNIGQQRWQRREGDAHIA